MRFASVVYCVVLTLLFAPGMEQGAQAQTRGRPDHGPPLQVARGPTPRAAPPRSLRERKARLHPVLSVSLWNPVSLPWTSRHTMAGVSVNVFYGVSGNLYGLEVGAGVNHVREDAYGLQLAGFGNVVLGSVHGLQVAGIINWVGDRCFGACIAGATNVHTRIKGLLLSGVFNYVRDPSRGVMLSGGFNYTESDFGGFQIAPGSWTGGRFRGAQIGIFNRGRGVTGMQIGVANFSCGRMQGLQLGLFNFAQHLQGFQIGVFNVSLKNGLPFMVGLNAGW